VIALAVSAHGGALHPLLWARSVGRGRVVHDALGHDAMAYRTPAQREIVRRAARWAIGLPIDSVTGASTSADHDDASSADADRAAASDLAAVAPDASLAYCRRTPDEGRIDVAEAQSSPAG